MKKLFYIIAFFPLIALAQSTDQNHVKTTTYKVPTTLVPSPTDNQKVQSITYLDGLGRPMQQIVVGQSGTGNNIVTPISYDSYGRQVLDYLPIPISGTSMSFVDNNTIISDPSSYYTNTYGPTDGGHRYSEKKFENSPLNRVLKQAAPGNDWALDAGHEIKFDYQTNTATDAVKLFSVTVNWDNTKALYDIPTSLTPTSYADFQLYKTITKDENWTTGDGSNNTTEEFKDKEGRVVLKRTYAVSMINNVATNTQHNTYYIYDQYGNLTFVIPPLVNTNATVTQAILNSLCYQYKYDYRNRLVEKKLPEKEWEFIVYDKLDRVVATGPVHAPFENLIISNRKGWLITKYDAFSRAVLTAWTDITTRVSLQTLYNSATVFNESKKTSPTTINSVAFNYTTVARPTSGYHVLTVNYYDDYNFVGAPTPADYATQIDGQSIVHYNNTDKKPKGLPTGSWVRVLENSTNNKSEITFTLYDKKSRLVRQYTKNHYDGFTSTDSKLDFTGKTLSTVTQHKKTSSSTGLQLRENFTYTNQDRLLTHTHQIIGYHPSPQLLAHNEYDELGQLIRKSVGGTDITGVTSLQKIDYRYNIRGWLKSINDIDELTPSSDPTDLFAFKISYNEVENDLGGMIEPLFNGNISETFWKTDSDNIKRNYGYQYDGLNRLTNSIYQKENVATNSYNERITYDSNGNITTMHRTGYQDGSDQISPYVIDDLIYGYAANSNQLRSVYDQSFKTDGFKDGPSSSSIDLDYDYDAFGNLIKDRNKGIPQNGIKYNHLNLPTSITFDNGSTITYLYNAVGAKLEKKVSTTSSTESTLVNATDYVGGFQYKDNELQFFPTAEGYVSVIEGPKFNYVFNYTDHLGNIRLSYTQSGTELKIMEENHYYPFGLKHSNYNTDIARLTKSADGISVIVRPTERSDYQYKYNGKELQDELGLNMYAMDARMYDPAIARWVVQDPVLHYNMSPYNAFDNNPVFWADPSGADATSLINDLWNKSSSGVTQYTKTGNGTFEQTDHVSDKELNNGMAILVAFPDQNPAIPSNQRTAKWLEKTFGDNDGKMNNAGHAGIIIIDGDTGFSRYFDFGRYEISSLGGLPADTGAVRSSASFSGLSVPNWDFKKSDIDNVSNMLTTIKNSSVFKGYGTIMGTLAEGLDFKAMLKYATEFEKKGYHPFGGYSSSTNPSNPTYCAKFARGVAGAGGFDWSYYVLSGKASVDDINKTNQCGVVKY